MTKVNKAKYIAKATVAGGTALSLGALSFTGMLLASASIPLAVAAFCFSSLIEGEVYKQNIDDALELLFEENAVRKKIIFNILKEKINQHLELVEKDKTEEKQDPNKTNAATHLKDYFDAREDLIKDNESTERFETFETEILKYFEQKLAQEGQEIEELLDIKTPAKQQETLNKYLQHFFQDDIKDINEAIQSIEKYHKLIIAAAIISGLTFAVASITAMEIFVTSLIGSSFSLLSMPLYGPILMMLFAFIGESLLMYNTLMGVFIDKKIDTLSENKTSKKKAMSVIKKVITALIILIAIFATISASSTYFLSAINSLNAMCGVTGTSAFIVTVTSVAMLVYGTVMLVFHIANALKTRDLLSKLSPDVMREKINAFKDQREKEAKDDNALNDKKVNTWQLYNPLRAISDFLSLIFKFVMFLGYVISLGFSENNLPGFDPNIVGPINSVNESLESFSYLVKEDKTGVRYDNHKEDRKGYIPDVILKIVLTVSLINVLAALWDRAFDKTDKKSLKNSFKKIYNISKVESKKNEEHTEGYTNLTTPDVT
ncbi:MAG: hypothetical protein COB50_04120 [Thiotrichales bacterium]|nr:MAG: hypothetical protein COB50_04120 [Thiotrichales bacterium]